MTITPQEVKRIAALARLGLTKQEVGEATKNLSSILDHFSTIQQIETSAIPTTDAPSGRTNVTREDASVAEALCATAELLERAPLVHNGHIKVHAVFS